MKVLTRAVTGVPSDDALFIGRGRRNAPDFLTGARAAGGGRFFEGREDHVSFGSVSSKRLYVSRCRDCGGRELEATGRRGESGRMLGGDRSCMSRSLREVLETDADGQVGLASMSRSLRGVPVNGM
jgi:hypothetical protein